MDTLQFVVDNLLMQIVVVLDVVAEICHYLWVCVRFIVFSLCTWFCSLLSLLV